MLLAEKNSQRYIRAYTETVTAVLSEREAQARCSPPASSSWTWSLYLWSSLARRYRTERVFGEGLRWRSTTSKLKTLLGQSSKLDLSASPCYQGELNRSEESIKRFCWEEHGVSEVAVADKLMSWLKTLNGELKLKARRRWGLLRWKARHFCLGLILPQAVSESMTKSERFSLKAPRFAIRWWDTSPCSLLFFLSASKSEAWLPQRRDDEATGWFGSSSLLSSRNWSLHELAQAKEFGACAS